MVGLRKPAVKKKKRVSGGSGSPGEEILANALKKAGMLGWVRQYQYYPTRKFAADFAWPELKIICEVEGGGGGGRHMRYTGFRDDCWKYSLASSLGYLVLRFTTEHVKKDIEGVLDIIQETINYRVGGLGDE